MYCKREIQKRIKEIKPADLTKRPSQFIKDVWLTASHKKILGACLPATSHLKQEPLDAGSVAFFGYCWTQVGRYSNGNSSSLDVALHTGIPPLIIAIYMDTYGMDWGMKLFEAKRIARTQRGKYTVLRLADVYATCAQVSKVLTRSKLKPAIFNKMIEEGKMEEAQEALLEFKVRHVLSNLSFHAHLFTNFNLKGDKAEQQSFKAQTFVRIPDLDNFGDTLL